MPGNSRVAIFGCRLHLVWTLVWLDLWGPVGGHWAGHGPRPGAVQYSSNSNGARSRVPQSGLPSSTSPVCLSWVGLFRTVRRTPSITRSGLSLSALPKCAHNVNAGGTGAVCTRREKYSARCGARDVGGVTQGTSIQVIQQNSIVMLKYHTFQQIQQSNWPLIW